MSNAKHDENAVPTLIGVPVLRLDRIYVRNAIGHAPVVLPSHPWSHLSDHAPLAAEIEL